MIETLFIISAVICINFFAATVAVIVGNQGAFPLPFLNLIKIDASNTYVSSPAIGFQVYFWATHFSIF